jgi:hypothetical protein
LIGDRPLTFTKCKNKWELMIGKKWEIGPKNVEKCPKKHSQEGTISFSANMQQTQAFQKTTLSFDFSYNNTI